ncbi:ferrous iron transport protein B [Hujiaoplasma nucleasis]|uniref:Ferrous iron transport protein B n=1 Tax=Hujiaoplasma nucleasis TaxID=2725268 RepID=A0A7L6N844_9MOLU|nr:ferrous iron transport protein B [Hujiaoplasma nucleasis]QLY40714.1 ferrous iron transport protein B [Hujiaoplasma nucleasis]
MNIALIGNPNAGKTTLFNQLTGSNQSVGNWPGVTVEKKSGKLKSDKIEANIIDLPGIYSLSTISLEEEIASSYVMDRKMDLIINIVDASNLERNLFLTYQLLDSNIPMVVALNGMDIIQRNEEHIDYQSLSKALDLPVIPISASKKIGIDDLIKAIEVFDFSKERKLIQYNEMVESYIKVFDNYIKDRFLSIRFFEDGLVALDHAKVSEKDQPILIELYNKSKEELELDIDMVLPDARYQQIINLIHQIYKKNDLIKETTTDKIDKILTHKYMGLPIFIGIMFSVFFLAFGPLGTWITDQFVWLIDEFFALIIRLVDNLGMSPYVSSLITRGIFGGLAAVVGFLPQLMILFFALAILEDSGYMSRAAFIMDRALRKFGLSGKSFIPMLIGFGCSVPAITATRTLDKDEDRKITSMIIPFVSCGAKAPIYGVFAGALFARGSYIVVFSMYLLGLLVAILSAILFKKLFFKSASANYIMELPQYRKPTIRNTWLHTWDRSKDFLIKAGTILLAAFIIIWFLSYFGLVDGKLQLLTDDQIGQSFLGYIGKALLPLFTPIGFNDWPQTVAILSGFVAKESVVGTLGILYGSTGDVVENGSALYPAIRANFTAIQAYSFMAFSLLAIPCIAAVSALKRELKSTKWFIFTLVYEMLVAYLVALLIFQIGSLPSGTIFTILFTSTIVIFVLLMVRKFIRQKGSACGSCDGCSSSSACGLPQFKEFKENIDKEKSKDEN